MPSGYDRHTQKITTSGVISVAAPLPLSERGYADVSVPLDEQKRILDEWRREIEGHGHKTERQMMEEEVIQAEQTDTWKLYECHKTVAARAMTRGMYNLVRGWDLPEENTEGYLVKYNAGTAREYISWSPADVFEEGYTLAETWLDRLETEHSKLLVKITALDEALVEAFIPEKYVELATAQLGVMQEYAKLLRLRITLAKQVTE